MPHAGWFVTVKKRVVLHSYWMCKHDPHDTSRTAVKQRVMEHMGDELQIACGPAGL